MLPNISSKSFSQESLKQSYESSNYIVSLEGIEDLFYDGQTEPNSELTKLQKVLDNTKNRGILDQIYTASLNRRAFQVFARSSCDIDADTANEIFSCSTNAFGDEAGVEELPDVNMTPSEFATAIVRLANLWVLMNEGMTDTSKLAKQTASFLKSL